ncbi:hypothetical protein ABFS83_09G010100 [Erythranthe nasuta]
MRGTRILRNLYQYQNTTQFKEPELFPGGHSLATKRDLLNYLIKNRQVQSGEVARVLHTLDRALFVPNGTPPYVDRHQPIGNGSSMFAPNQNALYLEFLHDNLKPGMHALDIGSGSGYLTACFGVMVGPTGRAVGVEKHPELVDFSVQNIEKSEAAPLLRQGSLSIHLGDGTKGWAEFAPYDAIIVGWIVPEIYPALTEQLKPGGRLLVTVEDGLSVNQLVVDKESDGNIIVRSKTPVHRVRTRGSNISVLPLQ